MADMPVLSEESAWLATSIVLGLIVVVAFVALNPQVAQTAGSFLCTMFYDVNYFFFGPRPPIELCGAATGAKVTAPVNAPNLPD